MHKSLSLLEERHFLFASELSQTLDLFLKSPAKIEMLSVEKTSFRKYLLSVNNPTFIATFSMGSSRFEGILEVNPVLVYYVINKFLGGNEEVPLLTQQLQKLEMAYARKFFNLVLKTLSHIWESDENVPFALSEMFSKSSQMEKNEQEKQLYFVTALRITMGAIQGLMTVALPFEFFKSLELTEEERKVEDHSRISLEAIDVDLTATIGNVQLSLEELQTLQKGDIVLLNTDHEYPVHVQIAGENKFKGTPGLCGKQKAVSIQKAILRHEVNRWTI